MRTLTLTLLACCLAGCALTSKNEPLEVRYYTPEALDAETPAAGAPSELTLRLRRIQAAGHLTRKHLRRIGPHSYDYVETQRWAEDPAHYLERALNRALFQEAGLRRSTAGPSLTVTLLDFEETQEPRQARVRLEAFMTAEGRAVLDRVVIVERPVSADAGPDAFAAALGDALRAAVVETRAAVLPALQSLTASE